MAISKDGFLSGRLGPLVMYTSWGKEISRTRPDRVKQTIATKFSARDFGNIKSMSSALREGLKQVVPAYKSKPVMFAMDEAVRRWYLDYYLRKESSHMDPLYFSTLRLNPEAPPYIKPLLGVEPFVVWDKKNKKVSLSIPAMKKEAMLLPSSATAISLRLHVTGACTCDREIGGKGKTYWHKSYSIEKSSEPLELSLTNAEISGVTMVAQKVDLWQDNLYLAFLSVRYLDSKNWIEEEKWKPLIVVSSWGGE